MDISLDVINGISAGVEFVRGDEEFTNTLVIDIFIIRFLIQWY